MNMPFGSRIVLEKITVDMNCLDIHIIPNYDIEQQWVSVNNLQEMWSLPLHLWPEVLDFERLELVEQPHEAISLVRVSGKHSTKIFVFKSVLRDIPYFYHELKILLTLKPHPNIISRPLYIVTKKCRFGGKKGVCGFILDYHTGGTLQQALWQRSMSSKLDYQEELRWAKQLLSALVHIRSSPPGFYSNLKLVNVVMATSTENSNSEAILIDFEQRSGFFNWSAPEVHYIQYLEHLATFSSISSTRARYTAMLQNYIPSWKPLSSKMRYVNPTNGYSAPWIALSHQERESAQVFMVGKLLWCIFEHASGISSGITVETFREEPCNLLFPNFVRTPPALRGCIRRCTTGAPEWNDRWPGVLRRGNRLYPFGKTGVDGEPTGTWRETQEAAKEWWRVEIRDAERFLNVRTKQKLLGKLSSEDMDVVAFMTQRPTLREVLADLENLEEGV